MTVVPWLDGFKLTGRDYHSIVASHPGYLVKLKSTEWYEDFKECWITNWANENVKAHDDGTPAYAIVAINPLTAGLTPKMSARTLLVARVLFDHEEDAALFKLTFMDKMTSIIHKLEN